MNGESPAQRTNDLMAAVRSVGFDTASANVEALLNAPPGRRPNSTLLELGSWYRSLAEHDRRRIRDVMRMGVDAGIFGLLCVLDGSRRAVPGIRQYHLQAVDSDDRRYDLTSGSGSLHEAYRDEVPPLGLEP